MAIAVDKANIGTNFVNAGAPTIAFTTTQTVAAGGFIVLGVGHFDGVATVASVAGGGLSWTIDKQGRGTVNANNDNTAIVSAQAPSGLASGATITATYSGTPGGGMTIAGMSFTGVKTSSPVDGTPKRDDNGVGAWSTSSYAIQAGSVIVAFSYTEPESNNTPTAPSIEAWEVDDPGGDSVVMEYRIESSAGSYAVAGTWSGNFGANQVAVAYLAAATGTSVLVPRHALGGGRW